VVAELAVVVTPCGERDFVAAKRALVLCERAGIVASVGENRLLWRTGAGNAHRKDANILVRSASVPSMAPKRRLPCRLELRRPTQRVAGL
jgi:hypothetical protein